MTSEKYTDNEYEAYSIDDLLRATDVINVKVTGIPRGVTDSGHGYLEAETSHKLLSYYVGTGGLETEEEGKLTYSLLKAASETNSPVIMKGSYHPKGTEDIADIPTFSHGLLTPVYIEFKNISIDLFPE